MIEFKDTCVHSLDILFLACRDQNVVLLDQDKLCFNFSQEATNDFITKYGLHRLVLTRLRRNGHHSLCHSSTYITSRLGCAHLLDLVYNTGRYVKSSS
jgi:hypothetical protein